MTEAVRRRMASGEPARMSEAILARGTGWSVADVICTSGPNDRAFAETHSGVSIGVVVAGTFQYRAGNRREVLTPGSVLLGNHGQCYECGHEHASGDRCVAFRFSPDYFDRIAADPGAGGSGPRTFPIGRLPPLRGFSRFSAAASAGLLDPAGVGWEELSLSVAAAALRLANDLSPRPTRVPRGVALRVTESVRAIERDPAASLTLDGLAREAGVSPYHYLRTFRQVTGVTPHQFILRTRLRLAATRLATDPERIAEIAFGTGFGDLSNFNHAFRAEYGLSPRAFRRRWPVTRPF